MQYDFCYFSPSKLMVMMMNSFSQNISIKMRLHSIKRQAGHFLNENLKINKTFARFKSQRQVRGDNQIQNFEIERGMYLRARFEFHSKPQRIFTHLCVSLLPHKHYGEHHLYFKLLTPLISDYDSLLYSHRCCKHCLLGFVVCLILDRAEGERGAHTH